MTQIRRVPLSVLFGEDVIQVSWLARFQRRTPEQYIVFNLVQSMTPINDKTGNDTAVIIRHARRWFFLSWNR
jgi:hypothetical protein